MCQVMFHLVKVGRAKVYYLSFIYFTESMAMFGGGTMSGIGVSSRYTSWSFHRKYLQLLRNPIRILTFHFFLLWNKNVLWKHLTITQSLCNNYFDVLLIPCSPYLWWDTAHVLLWSCEILFIYFHWNNNIMNWNHGLRPKFVVMHIYNKNCVYITLQLVNRMQDINYFLCSLDLLRDYGFKPSIFVYM
jgi:hypothetical protein